MTPPPSTSPQRIPIAYPVGSPSNSIFTSGSSAPRNYQARDRRKPLQLFSETVCCCCGTTLKVERGAEVVRCSVEGCEVVLDLREGVEEKGVGTAVDDDLDSTIRATFKDVASLNRSLRSEEDDVYSIEPIIDFRLRTMNNVDTLRSSITTFLSRPGFMPAGLDTTWVLLILLEFCPILDPSLVLKVIALLAQSNKTTQHSFVNFILSDAYSTEKLESTISLLVSTIARRLARCSGDDYLYDWGILAASRACSLLFTAANRRHLSIDLFYCSMIDIFDFSELIESFEAWVDGSKSFSFFQFPFLISLGTRAKLLHYESRNAMDEAGRQSRRSYYAKESSHLLLTVRRSHIVEDSLRVISLHRSDPDQNQLKKSLSIAFVEEAGVDAGGLKKEWFLQLVLQQFDPVFGMFVTKEGSSNCWFQPGSISTVEEFELVGIVVGLAIYHSVTLAIPLPPALYKKLCGERLSLADLAPIDPVLEKGLRTLLEFEGDVEETFSRDFVVSQGMPWEIVEHELVEGGKERAVTNENRGEFVALYVDHLLNTSIRREYSAFASGFNLILGDSALLSILRSSEIELILCGESTPFSTSDLRQRTIYDGFSEDEPTVEGFWNVLDSFDEGERKRFLIFVTGADRLPVFDRTFRFVLCCAGEESVGRGRYPTSRTCFHQLNLYREPDETILRERLTTAINGCEGFDLK